jgi:hypothetical protein
MSLAENFLKMYDTCKQTQSPEQCRELVMAATPKMVQGYLASYDTCLRVFKPETCRKWLAPGRMRGTIIALGIGAALGFLIGRR